MSNQERNKKWKLAPPAATLSNYFKLNPKHTKYLFEYETDVTKDPYHHPLGRITKLRNPAHRYPSGSHRWKKSDLRIVYFPDKTDQTISTLDADTAGNIDYKKRG